MARRTVQLEATSSALRKRRNSLKVAMTRAVRTRAMTVREMPSAVVRRRRSWGPVPAWRRQQQARRRWGGCLSRRPRRVDRCVPLWHGSLPCQAPAAV